MNTLKASIKFAIAAIVALALNFGLYTYKVAQRNFTLRKELAESGIKTVNYETRQDLFILEIPSENSEVGDSDIMLIRKTLNALRNANLGYSNFYIKLSSPDGKIIYSDKYSNIYEIKEEYNISLPEKTVDNGTYKYLLKYFFAENEMEMTAFNFYETKGSDSEALYIEVLCEKSTLSDCIEKTMSKLTSNIDEGVSVMRYSAVFKTQEGQALCAVSVDEYYGDTLYWKSSSCAGIKTIYD